VEEAGDCLQAKRQTERLLANAKIKGEIGETLRELKREGERVKLHGLVGNYLYLDGARARTMSWRPLLFLACLIGIRSGSSRALTQLRQSRANEVGSERLSSTARE
jgi:hypothetical protein